MLIGMIMTMMSCQIKNKEKSDSHKVVVKEVIQTSIYTYLLVEEAGKDQWVATASLDAKPGETYYYNEGLNMTNFESRELKKTFESIIFIQNLSIHPLEQKEISMPVSPGSARTDLTKLDINMPAPENGISIAFLYNHKDSLAGKKVIVRGVVSKFSPEIMGKNWIHLQDGSEYNGKFDLTATSKIIVNNGDTVTLEGEISLDNDLGYGYFFDVILENAKVVNN